MAFAKTSERTFCLAPSEDMLKKAVGRVERKERVKLDASLQAALDAVAGSRLYVAGINLKNPRMPFTIERFSGRASVASSVRIELTMVFGDPNQAANCKKAIDGLSGVTVMLPPGQRKELEPILAALKARQNGKELYCEATWQKNDILVLVKMAKESGGAFPGQPGAFPGGVAMPPGALPGGPGGVPPPPLPPAAARPLNPRDALKQIAMGIHNYGQAHRTLPPAYKADKNDAPLLSWRVLILPFIEGGQDLYKQFHLDEPWDSEHNKKLIPQMPSFYRDPDSKLAAEEGKTNYLTFRGEDTAFPGAEGIQYGDVRKGLSNTLMTIEVPDSKAVIWTKPDDLELHHGSVQEELGSVRPEGFFVGFTDGHVEFLKPLTPPGLLRSVATRNDGQGQTTWTNGAPRRLCAEVAAAIRACDRRCRGRRKGNRNVQRQQGRQAERG